MADVVTAFLRNRGEVLLVRRSDAVGSYPGRWGGVSGYVEGDPADAVADARRELREEVGAEEATLIRTGDPLSVVDGDREWTVHPFLFETDDRAVAPNYELADWEWAPPPAIRERDTVPALWETYERVAPTVETVAGDTEHGSAWLSARALEVLRDRAAVADEWEAAAATAKELLAARPSMAALTTRIDRAMARAWGLEAAAWSPDADAGTPAAVVESAQATLREALDADEAAADRAADLLDPGTADGPALDGEPTVATLSRSGTVTAALLRAAPAVLIGESRPAREGAAVAERLAAAGLAVTLTTDAALPWAFRPRAEGPPVPDAVLVGADAVDPDGGITNKVGTRALAVAAARADVPVYVVAARAKVRPDGSVDGQEHGAPEEIGGGGDATVWNPRFDRTPADCVTGVVTEAGVLDAEGIAAVAAEHRRLAGWRARE